MIDVSHLLLQSIIAPLIFSPIVLGLGRRAGESSGWIALIPLAYSLICLVASSVPAYLFGEPVSASYSWAKPLGSLTLLLDGISAPIVLTIVIVSIMVCVYSLTYMREPSLQGYYALYLLFVSGMLGTVLSINLAAFFLFFELMLIASWLLIALWGEEGRERAALKYFIYTEAGALFLLAGIAMTYALTGTLDLLEVHARAGGLAGGVTALIVSLMFIGFLVKMAIFPFHSWLPDAYTEAPMPITAIFSTMTGIGGYAALRILYTGFPAMLKREEFMLALAVLALITMIYGGYLALAQERLKRLLAYSSISQMGYLLFGVAAASIIGLAGAILIYVAHSLAKALLFMVSGALSRSVGTDRLDELGGLAGRMQLTSIAFMIGFLSLMGFPPLLGFWGELFIFAGSIYRAFSMSVDILRLLVTMIAIVFAIITAGYSLWTVRRSLFGEQSEAVKKAGAEPKLMLAPILASAIILIILGIQPTLLTRFLETLAPIFS